VINDISEVSEVWEFKAATRLQTHTAVDASGWHLLPFVRSLQLAFHGICVAGHFEESPPEKTSTRAGF
jgi:hypothetical protein